MDNSCRIFSKLWRIGPVLCFGLLLEYLSYLINFVFVDLANRAIVQEILFDKMLGKKRLMSWPDRFTNTIRCYDEDGSWYEVYRPSVVRNPVQFKTLWRNFFPLHTSVNFCAVPCLKPTHLASVPMHSNVPTTCRSINRTARN